MNEEIAYLKKIYDYYLKYTRENTNYCLLEYDEFIKKIIKGRQYLVSTINDDINGFLSSVIENEKAYITLVYGSDQVKEKLLTLFEDKAKLSSVKELWFHFFNPVQLEFNPLPLIRHPNAQGVNLNSSLHQVLLKLDYQENSIQDTYYRNLVNKLNFNEKIIYDKDYKVCFYDDLKHHKFSDFIESLNHKYWSKTLTENQLSDKPLPLLIATYKNDVVGFAGPLKVESDGRGYFSGIMVQEKHRKHHLGSYLFQNLVVELKKIGSTYMTLFTGRNNPAKYIYQKYGFQVVSSFVTMKKTLKEENNL